MSYSRIQPHDLLPLNAANLCILDVRTNAETNAESLANSLKIPLHVLTPERLAAEITSTKKDGSSVYLLCQGGKRAELAAQKLDGHTNARLYVVDGGIDALKKAGFLMGTNGVAVMSLERQVRIAAGLLVLSGVLLGAFVSHQFYVLSGSIGAGLMFAGITDTCMMGMLIARMPWNK